MDIRQMNFGLDLNIILKTAAQVFNIIFFKKIAERKRLKRIKKEEAKKLAA